MKTIKMLFFIMAGLCLLMACEKSDDMFINSGEMSSDDLKCTGGNHHQQPWRPGSKTVTMPFRADFIGNYVSVLPSAICGEDSWMMVTNEGSGTGTFLGRFTHHMEFCCELATGIYPGAFMRAYFVAANGDSLFVACAGQVMEGRAEGHPDYVTSYFRDPFVIEGGTGRFKGARGKGTTDDYNSSLDPYSHHHWTGTITLVKGKN
jgi:hypothetical protein